MQEERPVLFSGGEAGPFYVLAPRAVSGSSGSVGEEIVFLGICSFSQSERRIDRSRLFGRGRDECSATTHTAQVKVGECECLSFSSFFLQINTQQHPPPYSIATSRIHMDQDSHVNDAFLRSQEDNDSADDMTLPPSYEEATSQYAIEETTTTTSAGTTTTTTRGHGRSQSQSYSHYGGDTSGPSRSSDYNLNDDIQGSSDDDDDKPNQVPSARSTQTFIQPRSGHNMHRRHGSSGHHGHGHGHGHNHGHNHHGHHMHPAHFPGGLSHAPLAPNLEPTITPSAPPLSTPASSSQLSSQGPDASSSLRGPPIPDRPFMPFSGGVTPPYFPGLFPGDMSMPPMPHMPHMPHMPSMPSMPPMLPGSFGGGRPGFGFPGGLPHFAGFGHGPLPGPMGFMTRPPLPPPPSSSSSSFQFDSPTAPKEFKFAKPGSSTSTSKEGSQGLSSSTSGTSEQMIPPRPSSPSNGSGGGLPPQSIPTAGLMIAQDISTAEFSTSKKGVESKDSILDDPFQLYRFFVAHNDRPSMHVLITGKDLHCHVCMSSIL